MKGAGLLAVSCPYEVKSLQGVDVMPWTLISSCPYVMPYKPHGDIIIMESHVGDVHIIIFIQDAAHAAAFMCAYRKYNYWSMTSCQYSSVSTPKPHCLLPFMQHRTTLSRLLVRGHKNATA